jgi:hypothetical protein
MAKSVVDYRTAALSSFLEVTIKKCKSRGTYTAEQGAIFTFLEAHSNIILHVCSSEEERDRLISVADTDMASVVPTNINKSTCEHDYKEDKDDDMTISTAASENKSGAMVIDNSWQASFAAAVITAWLIMLSLGAEGTGGIS